MSVLIVVESQFGNTLSIARSVAAGLAPSTDVSVLRSGEAPSVVPAEVRLLVLGAPTHNLRLPNRSSRQQAVERGGTQGEATGLAEWIAGAAPRADLRVITFDTTTGGAFSGSAAKAAVKLLKRRGFRDVEQGASFVVAGTAGPLQDGEEARARSWGAVLGTGLG